MINQFVTRSLDKNTAETLFKLMLKYRPEDKRQKKDRLKLEVRQLLGACCMKEWGSQWCLEHIAHVGTCP